MKNVNQGIHKKDAMALLMGKPVYMDDLAPRDCLIVKVLRSPHANAMIQSVKTDAAMKVPGIAAGRTCLQSGLPWPGRRIRSPAPTTG